MRADQYQVEGWSDGQSGSEGAALSARRQHLPRPQPCAVPGTHLCPSIGSYGWPGFYGTAWYNDQAQRMTTIFIMQRAHAGDQRLPMWHDFWTAVYQAIDE